MTYNTVYVSMENKCRKLKKKNNDGYLDHWATTSNNKNERVKTVY